jgi:4-amino-4-deoxy-L-arabinose transferase-like glycosyltransferase
MSGAWSKRALAATAIAFVALAAGLLALYWLPEAKTLAGDEGSHYQPTALSILAGGDWFDRNMLWPPLQGLFMAGIYAVAGPHILAVQLVQLALLACCGFLLRRIWLASTGDANAAAWAGVLLAVNPLTIAFATYLWPEILHLFLSLLMAWLLLQSRHAAHIGNAVALAALAGVMLALCLLTKSLLTAFWPLLVLVLIRRDAWPASAFRSTAFVLALIVVASPALYRGWQETGHWQIADSSWFNLWAGLSDEHRGDFVFDGTGSRMAMYLDSAPDQAGRTDFAKQKVRERITEQGLTETIAAQFSKQYFRLFDSRNFLVAQLHGPECRGYIGRYRLESPGLNRAIDYAARAWHIVLLVMFALGLAAWRGWRKPWLWLLGTYVGYQLALFLGLHVKTRFLLPLLPVLCVFAAHFLAQFPQFRATASPLSPTRRMAGLLLAALLVFLALAGPVLDNACVA